MREATLGGINYVIYVFTIDFLFFRDGRHTMAEGKGPPKSDFIDLTASDDDDVVIVKPREIVDIDKIVTEDPNFDKMDQVKMVAFDVEFEVIENDFGHGCVPYAFCFLLLLACGKMEMFYFPVCQWRVQKNQDAIKTAINFMTALSNVKDLIVVGFRMSIDVGIWLRAVVTQEFPEMRVKTDKKHSDAIKEIKKRFKVVDLAFDRFLVRDCRSRATKKREEWNSNSSLATVLWILDLAGKYNNMKGSDVAECVRMKGWQTLKLYNIGDVVALLRLIPFSNTKSWASAMNTACLDALRLGEYKFSGDVLSCEKPDDSPPCKKAKTSGQGAMGGVGR